ncbi:MAG: pseudouridine synthase [Bacilli bacterium]
MRLDKLLSRRNYGSRKDVKRLINSGHIMVNSLIVTKSDYDVKENDLININNNEWYFNEYEYLAVHKKSGYVCANNDNFHQTIFDCLPSNFSKNFHVVGRLDIDTEGLVIITNDGEFTHKVISPVNKVCKIYEVHLKNNILPHYQQEFLNGIVINKDYKCLSATLEKFDDNKCYLTIYEGKFHQIKKMFISLQNEVIYLKRLQIGNLHLGTLPLGEYRMISKEQMYHLCISKENKKGENNEKT